MWQVQIKEQILEGLLRLRQEATGEGISEHTQGPSQDPLNHLPERADGLATDDAPDSRNGNRQNREELIKSGIITPLDDAIRKMGTATQTRGRMSLMDHKAAEGMKVKLPRPRRPRKRQPRARDQTPGEPKSQGGSGESQQDAGSHSPSPTGELVVGISARDHHRTIDAGGLRWKVQRSRKGNDEVNKIIFSA